MNKLTKIIAALLVCTAVVLAAIAWWMGSRPPAPAAPAAASRTQSASHPVVVAIRPLPAGKPVAADALQVMRLPMNPPGAFREIAAVAGKISARDIEEGTPVTERMISRSLAMQLGKGERAVAVPVDEIAGAGNRVEPGDYVDVFFTLKQAQDVDRTQARLLASRLRVLSYGAATVSGAGSGHGDKGAARAASAVLAVPVEEVNRIVLSVQSGRLLLAPRHPEDDRTPDLALFPEPAPALRPKPGLTRQQAEEWKAAENRAYAGMELAALANNPGTRAHTASQPGRTARPAAASASSLEVVRGSRRESVPY